MKRDMRHGIQTGAVLLASLLAACATGRQAVHDEGSERIEESMRPEAHPDVIPEGITLGEDAPPLAPAGPDVASPPVIVRSHGRHYAREWAYEGPVIVSGPVCGPRPHSVRYHVQATPGGTTPGLLP